jgi:hypothetical protein
MWYTGDQAGLWNWERFSNAEHDELMAASTSEMDPEMRAKMFFSRLLNQCFRTAPSIIGKGTLAL